MKGLVIGGVPEHFNVPWRRLIATLADPGVPSRASWLDFPSGTGAMAAALNDGSVDLAMLLTEGAVAGIANGGLYRIVSAYTETPLIWGIHVAPDSAFDTVRDLRGARYAISRYGSGSHLMAFAHARERGWPVGELKFVVVDNLDGALRAFAEGRADVFMWERFMTQPHVDAGRFRRIAEFSAPWPAFVACASLDALRERKPEIVAVIGAALEEAARFAAAPDSAAAIAAEYGLEPGRAAEWLQLTRWARSPHVPTEALQRCAVVLQEVGLVASVDLDAVVSLP